jgi:VTT domain
LKIVFLLRLSPVFPFTLLNYALGLTRVKLRDYAFASVLGYKKSNKSPILKLLLSRLDELITRASP